LFMFAIADAKYEISVLCMKVALKGDMNV